MKDCKIIEELRNLGRKEQDEVLQFAVKMELNELVLAILEIDEEKRTKKTVETAKSSTTTSVSTVKNGIDYIDNNMEQVREAIKRASLFDPNDLSNQNMTYAESIKVVTQYIKAGTDITFDDNYAIKQATLGDNVELVKFLLEAGADATVDDNQPIRNAVSSYKNIEIINILMQYGATIPLDIVEKAKIKAAEYQDRVMLDFLESLGM